MRALIRVLLLAIAVGPYTVQIQNLNPPKLHRGRRGLWNQPGGRSFTQYLWLHYCARKVWSGSPLNDRPLWRVHLPGAIFSARRQQN